MRAEKMRERWTECHQHAVARSLMVQDCVIPRSLYLAGGASLDYANMLRFSIDLDMVPLRLLHLLGEVFPDLAILLGNRRKAFLHAALHALQAAHVDVSLGALHQVPQLLDIF